MFKADWEKTSVTCQLPEGMVEKMVRLAYPDNKLISHELIAGGCANLNIKVLLEGEKNPLILRIYLRDKEAAHREQKLAALLKQTAPIPLTYYIGELEGYHFCTLINTKQKSKLETYSNLLFIAVCVPLSLLLWNGVILIG